MIQQAVSKRVLSFALLGAACLRAAISAGDQPVHSFLTDQFGLRSGELSELSQGRAVVRSLDTREGREIATLGVVRVNVPAEFYVDQLRDIAAFKRDEAVRQIGTFGVPARTEDVAGLVLDTDDVDRLSRCRPGDCKVQLSAEAIQRFQREVVWSAPDAGAAANRVMRAILVDLVNAYRESGDSALMTYSDQLDPLPLAEEFRAMTKAPPALLDRFPPLHRHLQLFPHGGDETIEDILYWSKEQLGPARIVSITHLAIAKIVDGPTAVVVASKQIYATHYFDASLGVTMLLRDAGSASSAIYLAYVNRSRIDALGGFLGAMKRALVRARSRGAMSNGLVKVRNLVERRFQTVTARVHDVHRTERR